MTDVGAGPTHRPIDVRRLHPRLALDSRAVVRALRVLDGHRGALSAGTGLDNGRAISVAFLTDADLARLHGAFLGDPAPTDVITFPGTAEAGTAGEICVSADAASRYCSKPARRPKSFSAELSLYLVHGWLHLAGHDDRTPPARRAMRKAEARALGFLRRENALPRFALRKRAK